MIEPIISVVMSVLNGERFLAQSVESILTQSFRDFEFLIVDDGSTDGTAAILECWRLRDPRIRRCSHPNRGLVAALNFGCGLARGRYIARMDADDVALPARLKTQFEFMELHPRVGVAGSLVEFIDASGQPLDIACQAPLHHQDIAGVLRERCALWHPSVIFRRELFEALGGYRKAPEAEDYDLWLRMAEHAELANLPTPLLQYRIHPGQISAVKCGRQVLGAVAARASALSREGGSPDAFDFNEEITAELLIARGVDRKTLHSSLAQAYLTWIRNMCRAGEYSFALNMEQIARNCDFRHARPWIVADLHLWTARASWYDGSPVRALASLAKAVAARPAILGRPVKAALRSRWEIGKRRRRDMSPATHEGSAPPRYVIVSPVRDEAKYLDETIRCVVSQTVRPTRYILVNDGSSDGTLEIIERWASEHPWIVPIHRSDSKRTESSAGIDTSTDRGKRAREAKEILAFYEGYQQLGATEWDFIAKLDGDLGFEPDYFERCFEEFEKEPKLGVGGGAICHLIHGVPVEERNPGFHVRGATKIYRKACWEAIGGVTRGAGWDTLDEVKANMLGWKSRSFSHLRVIHYRFTGAANGKWQNAVKKGEWNYISGYHPLFMAVKCAKHLFKRPYVEGAVGLFYGYLLARSRQVPRIDDPGLIRYVQDQQLRRLTFRETIWR